MTFSKIASLTILKQCLPQQPAAGDLKVRVFTEAADQSIETQPSLRQRVTYSFLENNEIWEHWQWGRGLKKYCASDLLRMLEFIAFISIESASASLPMNAQLQLGCGASKKALLEHRQKIS